MIVIKNLAKQESRITKQLVKIAINSEDKDSRDEFLSFVVLNGSDEDLIAVADLVKEVIAKTKKIADIQNGLAIEAALRWQGREMQTAKDILVVEALLARGHRKDRNRLAVLVEMAVEAKLPPEQFQDCFVIH
jgi:hypothetical protein